MTLTSRHHGVSILVSIGKALGYKKSELASLDEGNTLVIGGKEIEVW